MSDDAPEPKGSAPKDVSDSPSWADGAALGIGCLVTLILLGAALYFGISRG